VCFRWAHLTVAVGLIATGCRGGRATAPPSTDLCESLRQSGSQPLTAEAFRAAAPNLDPNTQAAALWLAEYIDRSKRGEAKGNVFSVEYPDGNPARAMFTISTYDLRVCKGEPGPAK
jgi:hypothetical protein